METGNRKHRLQITILILLLIFAAWAIPNAQSITDRIHSWTYTPPREITMIAEDTGMSDQGRELFYRYEPQILPGDEIEERCGFNEPVLGCFVDAGILLIEYETEAEYNRTLVTAAHEMLHVAFSRQSEESNRQLEEPLMRLVSQSPADIRSKITDYSDSRTQLDEAFAVIGTEVGDLPSNLEKIYYRYFDDRGKVINAFQSSPEAD